MSRVLLLRHAQASYLEPDYDKLSPIGEKQARALGEYWARQKINFDRVFSGPRVRQMDTARIAAAGPRAKPAMRCPSRSCFKNSTNTTARR